MENTFAIYWDDLNENTQKSLRDFLGGSNGNYDVFPIVEIYRNDEDEED